MSQQQRLNQVLDMLAQTGQVAIDDIVTAMDVSPATARRDLNTLAEQRLVTRTHGGAVVVGSAYELPLQYKIARNSDGKKAIAAAASRLVSAGDVVGLTGGTTTSEVARSLGMSPHLEGTPQQAGVTIVTNALNIAYELAIRPQVKIVVTGGTARSRTFELVGPLVEPAISGMVLDWTFIGVDGVHAKYGVTTVSESEAAVNRALAKAARKAVVVADGSKMLQTRFSKILDFSEVDIILTDSEPPDEIVAAAEATETEIVVAGS